MSRLEATCARFRIPLAAAALQFPLAHPAVTTVVPGVDSVAPMKQTLPNQWGGLFSGGPRQGSQSPIRGRGLRRATSVKMPITARTKLAFGRNAPLGARPRAREVESYARCSAMEKACLVSCPSVARAPGVETRMIQTCEFAKVPIPAGFWAALKAQGLLAEDAPVPVA